MWCPASVEVSSSEEALQQSLVRAQDLDYEIGRAACLCQSWVCGAKTEGLHADQAVLHTYAHDRQNTAVPT